MTAAIDFDGVIHKYSKGWHDGECYDVPVRDSLQTIGRLMKEGGYSIFIFSTRNPEQIKAWMEIHCKIPCEVIPPNQTFWNKKGIIGITNTKLAAHVYVDDRAINFYGNWDETEDEIKNFKTYTEQPKNNFPKSFTEWLVREGWEYENGKWVMPAALDFGSKTTDELHNDYLYEKS